MTDTPSKRKVKPVAAGCVVTWNAFQIVLINFTCFAAFTNYGASNAALGASVPALARSLNQPESRIGFIFIFRGAGFLTGTLGSAVLMGYENLPLSKEVITCLASILMGVMTYFMSCTNSYNLVLALSVFQGLGFGGIDCISNCLFPELWSVRIQPWMQALHLCFGIGAMIGPTLVGSVGYVITYRVLGVLAFLPLVALQGYRFFASAASTAHLLTQADSGSVASMEGNASDAERYKYVSTSITEDDNEMNMDTTYSPFTGRDKDRGGGDDRDGERSTSLSSLGTTDSEADSVKSNTSQAPSGPPVTFKLRMLILFFYVIYTGSEAGYAGWIPVYVLQEHITTNDSHAAYVSATFWATMTIGRTLAVLTAMAFSATTMLRFHLSFTVVCATMFMFVERVGTLNYALIVAALMGLALSAIYPLVMTIVIDYGYTMDSYSTTLFMVGATMGEAGLPMAIGLLLEAFGSRSLPWTMIVCAALQVITYASLHVIGSQGTGDFEYEGDGDEAGTDTYSKISLETDDDTVEDVEMVDLQL